MPDPTNPVRLAGSPALGEPALGLSPVAVVERSPTGLALLGQSITRAALVVQGLSGAAAGIFALFLPQPWAVTGAAISAAIFGACSVITGAGPGLRTGAGTQPVTFAAPPPAPSSPFPRIGPPV